LARLEKRWRRIESSNDLLGLVSSSAGEESEGEAMGWGGWDGRSFSIAYISLESRVGCCTIRYNPP
jgi:hypothetical protein